RSHGGRNLPQNTVGQDHPDGAQDQVRPGSVIDHGVFAGGTVGRPGLEHGAGGHDVGTYGQQVTVLGQLGSQHFDQLDSHAAALAVHYQDQASRLHTKPP